VTGWRVLRPEHMPRRPWHPPKNSAFRCMVQHCISPRSSVVAPGLPGAVTVSARFSFFSSFFCQALAPADLRARRKKAAAPMITAAMTMMR
jgi:hypothetical protein